jgi:hypothetical protein
VTTCEDLRLATCATQTASTSTHQPSLSASTKTTTKDKRNIQQGRYTINRLSLAKKIQIIESHQKFSTSVRQLAIQFKCSKTQISSILSKKDDYLKEFEEEQVDKKSNISDSKNGPYLISTVEKEELHQKVFYWYTKQINKGILVNGPMIQREAQLHNPKFLACNQWLCRFKRQYNICITYNSEDDNDDASREHLTSNQLGSPRAQSATQLSDSQPTVILPQFATTLMSPYHNKTKILANRDIAKGGLVPSQPNIFQCNEILF